MSNPMDLPFLNLNNYEAHPSQKEYMVFFFSKLEASNYFENSLKENDIFFERDQSENLRKTYLFAIKRKDIKTVEHLNHLTLAEFRKPTIQNKAMGIGILVLTSALLILAIIGYFLS